MRVWLEFWIALAGLGAMLAMYVLYQAVAVVTRYDERDELMLPLLLIAVGVMALLGLAAVGLVV